ncbi:MAG: EAL domain-containing protein [Campylobacterales bacterium]|nr:EAL domain-containing protein [Campylobacterales bacterium]
MFFKKDLNIYIMLFLTLVLPLVVGLYMQNFSQWRYVSVPLHSLLEASGAMIAFIISAIIFLMYKSLLEFNHFHRASFALLSMGVFDAFHAMTYPGEMFVWLHSLAIFFGGIIFALVWMPDTKVSRGSYIYLPIVISFASIAVSIISMSYPDIVPQMLNEKNEFTDTANILNMVGGSMFVVASFYFIKKYIQNHELDDLLFAGHTMLFGSAGILFFFSTLWDMQWWFWHSLRLLAYIVSLYFMFEVFYKNVKKLEYSNKKFFHTNINLNNSIKLLEEYKNAIYQSSIISTSDLDGNITYVNDELLKVTGYSRDELMGQPHSILRHPDTSKEVFAELWESIKSGKTYKGFVKNRKKDGSSFYVKLTIVPIFDSDGEVFEYLALRDNVSELVKSQKELKRNFFTDALTGLDNRFKLNEDLKRLFDIHIALLNIDNFKSINDFYGQEFGDELLKIVANDILEKTSQNGYSLYRNHGDEFVVVTKEDDDFEEFIAFILSLISGFTNKSLKLRTNDIHINITCGLVESSKEIIKADLALKEAKKLKKEYIVYNDNLNINKIFKNNILWSKKIKTALDEDRIVVFLQPIYENSTQMVQKYEALVRYIEDDGKIISPFEFLEAAKRTKLYFNITKRVIREVFKILNETDNEISINICAEDILNDDVRGYLLNMIQTSKNSNKLVVELVESEGIEGFDEIIKFIEEIKESDVKLAIDDFGTGYSNFEYLLKLKADYIKIDGSMIKDIVTNVNNYNVVETIVIFARKNGMKVIAEFVSSKEIQDKILELGIDFSQGYFIDKPKPWSQIR